MFRLVLGLSVLLMASALGAQQQIITATDLFNRVNSRYAQIRDYTARVVISQGETVMRGNLFYKAPNKLRIDFQQPSGQVLVSDGRTLSVYLPSYAVAFTQELGRSQNISGIGTGQGLRFLRNNYSIAYLDGPNPQTVSGIGEPVVRLRLTWKTSGLVFRQIELAVNQEGLIRRIVGTTVNLRTVQMDFSDIEVNVGIPESRFQYETPPNANRIHNYLFEPEG